MLSNYEASRDGIVRNRRLKKPVGVVSNAGYLRFAAGRKKYLNHRIAYECFNGLIEDGFVIDHKKNNKNDNSLQNLQAVTQSQNTKKGETGKYGKQKRPVVSFDTETNEQKTFHSMNAAAKYFDICTPSVQKVAEQIYKSATSKKNGHTIQFKYITPGGDYSSVDIISKV